MDDRDLLSALTAGDPRQLAVAYRTFADPLYTYCLSGLVDPEPAAAALHDTFVVANAHGRRLTAPERLRSWLYAVARNECLRRTTQAGQAPVTPAPEQVPADPGATSPELLHQLVWAAAGALSPESRELFELTGRHGLATHEAGELLGIPVAQAPPRFARAHAGLERAIGALLIVRSGQRDCPWAAEAFAGWDGRFTPAVQERALRHLDNCRSCAEGGWRRLPPALISAYRSAPFLPAPSLLWHRLRLHCFDPGLVEERAAVVRRAGRFDPATGFPSPVPARRQRRAVLVGAGVAAVVLLAGATGALALAEDGPGEPAARAPASSESLATAGPTGSATEPAQPRVARGAPPARTAPAATLSPTPGPTPSLSPSASAPPPAQLSLQAELDPACPLFPWQRYRLEVSVQADQPLAAAELVIDDGSGSQVYPMQVDDDRATVRTDPREDGQFVWWIEATGTQQQTAATDPDTADPC